MARKKTWNLWAKLRAAVRDVYRYSPMRREALKTVQLKEKDGGPTGLYYTFTCAICKKDWATPLAEVDHNPALGSFDSWETFADWCKRMFEGPTQVVDKMCHKKKSVQDRKKISKKGN